MMQSHVNTFTNGMSQDQSPQLQQSTTYIDALNGRIVYNANGTFSFQNAKGNKEYINLTSGYMPIGYWAVSEGYLVVFSTDGTNSEIGFIQEDTFGQPKYTQAFNDLYDPYGDKLTFSKAHPIIPRIQYNNDDSIVVYWCDNYNEDKAFNIMAGKSFSWQPSGLPLKYPTDYNVHNMSSMMNFQSDIVQYKATISGNKLTGKYQYCYRLIHQNGYKTPFTIPSGLITLTQNAIDSGNWTNYNMSSSGVNSDKGINVVINNVDARFSKIELVCIHWITDTAPNSAYICQAANIPQGTPLVQMEFSDTTSTGVEVLLTEITQEFTDIYRSKTLEIFRDNLHKGNVTLADKLEFDTSNIEVVPCLRNIQSDTSGATTNLPFTNSYVSGTDDCKPIDFANTTTNAPLFKVGEMDNEYYNYKGTQIENRFKGYFRSETYPFAIVLYDMKGQPMWANHIADIQFPTQYGGQSDSYTRTYLKKLSGIAYTDKYVDSSAAVAANSVGTSSTDNNTFKPTLTDTGTHYFVTDDVDTGTNESVIRSLGVMLNNIDLTNIINDAGGKQQVSGFSIVRMPRYKNIAFQGALSQAVGFNGAGGEYLALGNAAPSGIAYWNTGLFYGGSISSIINTYAQITTPDFAFAGTTSIDVNSNCRIALQGMAYDTIYGTQYPITMGGGRYHSYNKMYQTQRINDASGSGSNFDNPTFYTNTYSSIYGADIMPFPTTNSGSSFGVTNYIGDVNSNSYQYTRAGYSVAVSAAIDNQFGLASLIGYSSWLGVANYTLGVTSPTITTTELETRIYNNIGHFIPLTPDNIAAATDSSGNIIFNGVEVYGGDCYLGYYDSCRLIPYQNATSNNNFGTGLIFPCESEYNFDMRNNRAGDGNGQYAKVGTQKTVHQGGQFNQGIIMSYNNGNIYELFDLNKVMLAYDNWYNFFPKPATPTYLRQPILHYFSNTKIVGETTDSYRIFLPNNFNQVDGSFGEIIHMDKLFNDLYLFQNSGFCRARFKERAMVATTLGDLSTATGEGLQGYDYVNKEVGLQSQLALTRSGKAFYWIDALKGKFLKFSQAGVEDVSAATGMHNYIYNLSKNFWRIPPTYFSGSGGIGVNYNVGQYTTKEYSYVDAPCGIDADPNGNTPLTSAGGIQLAYDYKNESVILCFSDVVYSLYTEDGFDHNEIISPAQTIEYNELINKMITRHDFKPNFICNFNSRVLYNYSPMNGGTDIHKLYVHDEGVRGELFGNNYNTKIKFAVNPHLGVTKYLHNGRLNVNELGVSLLQSLDIYTQNLATQSIVLNNSSVDSRPICLEGTLRYPLMQQNQDQRIRDKYAILEFTITNDGSDKLVDMTSHETLWMPSQKL